MPREDNCTVKMPLSLLVAEEHLGDAVKEDNPQRKKRILLLAEKSINHVRELLEHDPKYKNSEHQTEIEKIKKRVVSAEKQFRTLLKD